MVDFQPGDHALPDASVDRCMRRFKNTTVGLILLFALGNLLLPSVFWDFRLPMMYIPLSVFGICVTQIVLLGIWAALGALAIKYRFPLTLGLATFLAASYVAGLENAGNRGLPRGVGLTLMAFALLVYLVVFVGLRLVRSRFGLRLQVLGHQAAIVKQGTGQVSVGYLMGATTIAAFAFAVIRYSIPQGVFDYNGPSIVELIWNGLFFTLAINTIAIGALFLVFSQKRVLALLLLSIFLLLLPWLHFSIVGWRFFSDNWVLMSYSFFLGFVASLLLVLYLVRSSGVRMDLASSSQRKRS